VSGRDTALFNEGIFGGSEKDADSLGDGGSCDVFLAFIGMYLEWYQEESSQECGN